MSDEYISISLRELIAKRAGYRCEYCLVSEHEVLLPHQPDHIIARQHRGQTTAENLAFACIHCNRHKGPNIASIDPSSNQLTPLYNPRTQIWTAHFMLEGAYIRPLTAVGRVTVQLLKINYPDRIEVRRTLLEIGRYP